MLGERFIMKGFQETETIAIKACCSCSGGLFERDRFCRWCGAPQTGAFNQSGAVIGSTSPYTTSALEGAGGQPASFRPVSGPLVEAMIAGMSAGDAASHSRAWRVMVQMLISIPIWLMIVLLAPFDAFAAARTISRHFASESASQPNPTQVVRLMQGMNPQH